MTKEEIIDYVMQSPENTNPNVLRGILSKQQSDNKFWVTLTLTSEQGGIADYTNAEISEAFEAGKDVWFKGEMNGMFGHFPLKALTYVEGLIYPFIGAEFDLMSANTSSGISSVTKTMIAICATNTPTNIFWMKSYPLDSLAY